MKRHWKNMHGIRLTDAEEDSEPNFYVNVVFGAYGQQIHDLSQFPVFCYPSFCVRLNEPCPRPRVDPRPIVDNFVAVLQERLPAVCGQALRFYPGPSGYFPQTQMAKASTGEVVNAVVSQPCLAVQLKPPLMKKSLSFVERNDGDIKPPPVMAENAPALPRYVPQFKAIQKPQTKPIPQLAARATPAAVKPTFAPHFTPRQPKPAPLSTPSSSFAAQSSSSAAATEKETDLGATGDDDNNDDEVPAAAIVKLAAKKRVSAKGDSTQSRPAKKKAKSVADVEISDVEVRSAAASNFKNLSCPQLISWLRSKGVACKVKDKKGDLVTKTQDFLTSK